MAYSVHPRWSHGDVTVSAARLQIYSDDLDALNAILAGDHFAIQTSAFFSFINIWRWLHYMTASGKTGTIVDPSGVNADVSLTDSTSSMAVYDLSNVSWLVQGQAYKLTGMAYAAEDSSG